MNPKAEDLFKSWLKLSEDEKRDFIKSVIHFNQLPKEQQDMIVKQYIKS